MKKDDVIELIPEMTDWQDAVMEPRFFAGVHGNLSLAVSYSFLFWPSFVQIGEYVVREGTTVDEIRAWEDPGRDARDIEAVLNHIHIGDIHFAEGPPETEPQLRHLGRVLTEIHRVKLARDFPQFEFEVDFNDEPGLDPIDYQFTFWRVRGKR